MSSANSTNPLIFQCKICSKIFKIKGSLTEHVKRVHGTERPYSCSKCSYTCKRKHDLKTHTRRVHDKLFPHVCIFCDKTFLKMGDVNKHLRTHTREKPHACLECPESFTERHNMERHIRTTHMKLPLGFKCPGCPKYLANEDNYKKHLEKHNFEKRDCDTCGKSFSSEFTLAKHMIRMHSERRVECEYCSKRFGDQASYRSHLIIHGTKSSVCNICGKSYFKGGLRKHMRQVHEPHKFECEFCHKTFALGRNLELHRIRVHFGVPEEIKQFQCSTCEKRFFLKADLKRHELCHGTSRPFKCDVCNKCFKVKINLYKHKQLHDGTKRKIRFLMCPHCLKGLKSRNSLNNHIARVHFGAPPRFSCIFCGATAYQRSQLFDHIRRCIREKPYICEREGCHYSAVCKPDLDDHIREEHTGERPFKCDPSCGETFANRKHFCNHRKSCPFWNSQDFHFKLK